MQLNYRVNNKRSIIFKQLYLTHAHHLQTFQNKPKDKEMFMSAIHFYLFIYLFKSNTLLTFCQELKTDDLTGIFTSSSVNIAQ